MKNILRITGAATAAVALSLLAPSCAYDPGYYGPSSSSVSASYSSGYGHGYGYGGSSFSTSLFVSTGDSRWGYDPYCQSYYDYHRRAYYDPYLYGYYPVGYRPPMLVGCPHPYGWSSGRYIAPPRVINNYTVVHYSNRERAYRSSSYDWAHQVRTKPVSQHVHDSRPSTHHRNDARPQDSHRAPHRTSSGGSHLTRPDRTSPARPPTRHEATHTSPSRPQAHRNPQPNRRQQESSRSGQPQRHAARHESRDSGPRQSRGQEARPSRQEEHRSLRSLGESRGR